ncbi:hypothetical protein CU102_12760 [Phyllobacterium brassicacearum]|uniref:Bacteriophage tail tape measure N-terminal domain-containing protein n=1 Tax=Phyllobacterium brassicacearum TaxID=314235 RepID=A0A2P7BQ93_9HYPH|nr:phage tail length tape measure family protein [Phyllobacterium brassicacearum]PSH68624.1 hypothetical protein CU102_12760 [Phyllobacterium brassicacearum]TDQ24174.1 tail length tape measure protein [Phyllobacterium brassicacearum]
MSEATLGFKIDSGPAQRAAVDLDQLAVSATRTESAVVKMGQSGKKALSDVGAGATEFAKSIQRAAEQAESTGARINRALNVRDTFAGADRGRDIEEYGRKLDGLRAKFNPLYAAVNSYRSQLAEIRDAHRLGAISSSEMTAAMARERQAALASVQALRSRNAVIAATPSVTGVGRAGIGRTGNNSYETANIAAQFQDIAVTSAMGSSPLQIALQQGTQLSAVFEQMKASGRGAGAALLGAFTSIISPISLVTIGLVAGTAALIQYFSTAESGTEKTSKLFEEQNDIIREAASLWGDATPQLKAYVDELDRANQFTQGREAGEILAGRELDGLSDKLGGLKRQATEAFRALNGDPNNAVVIRDLRTAWSDLRERLDAGTASMEDLNRVQGELSNAVSQYGVPEVLRFKDAFDEITDSIYRSIEAAQKARSEWIAAQAGGTNVQDIVAGSTFTDGGRTISVNDMIPINPPVPTQRPLDLNREPIDQSRASLSELANMDFSTSIQGASSLGKAIGTVTESALTATNSIINVNQELADSRTRSLIAFEQQANQLRSMKTELSGIQQTLAEAAKTPVSDVFGLGFADQSAADAIDAAATSIQKVFAALEGGQITAKTAHESLELVRASLKRIGGDSKSIDLFINALINGNIRVLDLLSNVKSLSNSILNIPDKLVSIGIQQYTVPSADGGTKNVNVLGGNPADMTVQQYTIGGKTHNVYGGNGSYRPSNTGNIIWSPSDIMAAGYTVGGARAAGGPVTGGETYLVGENGPELVTMGGSGMVANTNSTASILSGGRDTLSLMEDHLYNILNEVKIHTNYFETVDGDFDTMIAALQAIKTSVAASAASAASSVSSSTSSGSSSSGYGGGWGGNTDSSAYNSAVDYTSAYNFMGYGSYNGTGAIGYDTYSINPSVHGPATGIKDLHKPAFATGGQIMPGEDQRVEFFKKNSERVIIVDDKKVSDSRGGQQSQNAERPISLTVQIIGGDTTDKRSQQAVIDQFRRAVQQAVRSN